MTSLGLDGEATDALTGLPKPRYAPQAGVLVATTAKLLQQAESEGVLIERLQQLPGRTALGPVILARILRPGHIIIAGPTLLRDLRSSLNRLQVLGAHLGIVDGTINRLGAAAPNRKQTLSARLYMLNAGSEDTLECFSNAIEPTSEACWIATHMQTHQEPIFVLHGALTEELSRALLVHLPAKNSLSHAELIVEDSTKIFCHSVVLQRLSARGLDIRVADPVHILAMTINPYAPEYACSSQQLLDALLKELPSKCPPIIDAVAGYYHGEDRVTPERI